LIAAVATPAHWLPQLIHNAELARDACDTFLLEQEYRLSNGAQNYRDDWELTSLSASYYLLRNLVNAYSDVSLQQALSSALDESTLEEIRTHESIGYHMRSMEREEAQRHAMTRPEETWEWWEKEECEYGIRADWDWAFNVIRLVWFEKETPGFHSPNRPCPWRFGKVCCDKECGRGLPIPEDVSQAS
jgi:hypothetical protein